jgi:hypothetical protein
MSRLVLSAIVLALALFGATVWAEPALADRRVALIVGNSAYQNAPVLPNPAKDAKAIAAMFTKAGYDVVSAQYDVGNLDFKRAIRQFEDAAADADIAVIYYAGHGLELHGTNYLIPVDAKLKSDRDADDEAITLDRLSESIDGAKKLRVIILDACRDNPFGRTMKKERTAALRGVNPGLGAVEVTGTNTLVAYAARAGFEAEDGEGDHSPFALALINNLFVPGLDIRLAFGRVRDEVLKKTGNRQEPYVYGSLGAGTVALVPAPAVQPAVSADDLQGAKNDYSLVEKIGTKGAWEVFLTQHPNGFYSNLARQQIAKLDAEEAASSVTRPQPTLASLEPPTPPPTPPGPSNEEMRSWDRIKDSSNEDDFRNFIKNFPTSVLANIAQTHIDAIERAAREQAAKAKAALEAAAEAQRQADAKRQADEAARQKAEQEAALAKAQAEAKAAEAARAQAERDAALKRDEEARQKALADAAKAQQEAAAAAARQKADQDATLKAQQEAARKKAEQEAALLKAQQESQAAEQARQAAEREAALKRQEEAQKAAAADVARKQEAACNDEQTRLGALQAAGKQAKDDLTKLSQTLTCERLRPLVTAALDKASAPDVNTPDQVRAAQQQLARLGCFSDAVDGNLNDATATALQHYRAALGKPSGDAKISDALVSELKGQSSRVCPLVCPPGKVSHGDACVVVEEPKAAPAKPQQAKRQDEKPAPRQQPHSQNAGLPRPVPSVRQEASSFTGGGGGGHSQPIGVGF